MLCGRAKTYELTADGKIMRSRILAQDRANMTEVLSSLSESEQETMLELLERIEKNLRNF